MRACNLIPRARREKELFANLRRRWGTALGVCALGAVGACAVLTAGQSPATAAASARSIQAIERDHEQVRRELGQLKVQLSAARRQLERSLTIASHPDFSPLLGELARERHGEVVLESCNLRPGAMSTAENPADRRPQEYVLTIAGLAREAKGISAYAAALEATGVFDAVTIQEMRGRDGRSAGKSVGFSLRCLLREGAPIGGGKP